MAYPCLATIPTWEERTVMIIMVVEYQTRQDLLAENAELEGALGDILDEVQKEKPDLDVVEEIASEALGVEEPDDGESEPEEGDED